ncbi:MAG: hypothetical protein QNK23_06630 [Crocinitomicaceae bacterium]|nr:hypothetical protein [Crocinitomicaceae bacterium]
MKKMKLSNLFYVVLIAFLGTSAFGQTEVSASDLTSEWQLMQENNGVQFFVRRDICTVEGAPKQFDYSFANMVNTTNVDKTVVFQMAVQYDSDCYGCTANVESVQTITIPANSSLAGDCTFEQRDLSKLINNLNFDDGRTFESLKLIEFKVD